MENVGRSYGGGRAEGHASYDGTACAREYGSQFTGGLLSILLVMVAGGVTAAPSFETDSARDLSAMRGEYIYRMAGCESCHAEITSQELGPAGGVALETPFGIFYSPNITPDRETGIGTWSDNQFIDAMRKGLSPDGAHYYPSFPYTCYTKMTDGDLLDLKAYLDSLQPIVRDSKAHELSFPFDQRWLIGIWKRLFFDQRPFQSVNARTEAWNRGNYIVNGPGHCIECHTPRNLFGGLQQEGLLMGNPEGPEGEYVPPINGALSESFGRWSSEDIVFALQSGMLPDGDFMGGSMGHVIENSTSELSDTDLQAVAEYLMSPAPGEKSTIWSRLFGMGDATVAEDGDPGDGRRRILSGGVLMWLVWLGLILGTIGLAAKLVRRSR